MKPMPTESLPRIDPAAVAFDIDGVVADTMRLFVDIVREEFRRLASPASNSSGSVN